MQQHITINPSIATIVDIALVSLRENRPVFYRSDDENWPGTYNLKIWNSSAKNTPFNIPENTLSVVEKLITFNVSPSQIGLTEGKFYYEIFNVEMEAIFFKGELEIVK